LPLIKLSPSPARRKMQMSVQSPKM